jgi:putative tryptophan/tyrosine transport system substrate-binding protein
MRRRDLFVASLAAVAAWPCAAPAQVRAKVLHIGMLRIGPPPPSFIDPFRNGLSRLGYVEGRDFVIEPGFGSSVAELPELAADLVRRNIDVLVASGSPAVLPARNATQSIPVVFVAAIDPVAVGLVSSLARPGGNVTGLTALFADLMGKRLELLKDILPSLSEVAFPSRENNPGHEQYLEEIEKAGRTLNVKVRVLSITNPSDFGDVFRKAQGADGLIQIDDAMFTAHREELVALCNKISHPRGIRTTRVRRSGRLCRYRAKLLRSLSAGSNIC